MPKKEALFNQGYHTAKERYLARYAAKANQMDEMPWLEQVEACLEYCERYLEQCNAAKEGVMASHSYREGVLQYIQVVRNSAYGSLRPFWIALARAEEMR